MAASAPPPVARSPRVGGTTLVGRLLLQYRVMAYVTAVLLIVLVFVGIPLQFGLGEPQVASVVGTCHGILYVIYLVAAFRLTRHLGVPKWQMALVLLAGTVPFCAVVAERKLTRRFARTFLSTGGKGESFDRHRDERRAQLVRRWFSGRALCLHLGVVTLVPACALAGWWQATRALAGNSLSWVYSIEWPIFGLLAIAGWWHLLHEDPEEYRSRKLAARRARAERRLAVSPAGRHGLPPVDLASSRAMLGLAVAVGVETVLGAVAVAAVPFSRPSGLVPHEGRAVFVTHAVLGTVLVVAGGLLIGRTHRGTPQLRVAAWTGMTGLLLAGVGGLLTIDASVVRFCGMVLMCVGPLLACLSYVAPAVAGSSRRRGGGTVERHGEVSGGGSAAPRTQPARWGRSR